MKTENLDIRNMDCMELMRGYPDNHFDLAVVDPPYGINVNVSMGRRKGDKKSDYQEFDLAIAESFSPRLISTRQVVEKVLVPKYIGPKELIKWRDKSSKTKIDTSSAITEEVSMQPAGKDDIITWENSRSIQELKIHLDEQKTIEISEDHVIHLLKMYTFASSRESSNVNFAETLGMLYNRVSDKTNFNILIEQLSPESKIWHEEYFTESAVKLPAKVLDGFFFVHMTSLN